MAMSELEELAKRHGALSYRNRADTQNPAIGFSAAGLASLVAEVRKADTELIRQMLNAMTAPVDGDALHALHMQAITAARARLEG